MPQQGDVFTKNQIQVVRLPTAMHFPKGVKKVHVRSVGKDRIISPVDSLWDSFFLSDARVTEDFMTERADQAQPRKEIL